MDDLSKKHNRNLQSLGKASVPQGEDNVLSPQKFREAIINIDTTHNLTPAETTVEVENAENQPEVADHLENSNPMNRGQSRQKKNRIISINKEQKDRYVSNHVTTAKYSFLTFVPFFLYEQFRRYSNIFFLCTIILQQIPDVSPTGKYTTFIPFVTILSVSAIKELVEDIKRHRADKETNHRLVEVLRSRRFKTVLWKDVKVGEFVKIHCDQPIPGDTVLYSTSEPMGICYIETANLDGETNLKVRQAIPQTYKMIDTEDFLGIEGSIECELPNRLLYQFAGKIKLESEQTDLPLGPDQLLLRGAMLRNTKWVYGQIIYTGHETKLMLNSSKAPLKRSTLDKMTNNQIIFLFIVLIFVSLFSTAFYEFVVDHDTNNKYMGPTSGFGQSNKIGKFVFTFLTFSILYNNLIPISLSVTLEVVRFTQAKFINSDKDMYHAETDTPALARTSNLNEELGEIRYIFSDKTGTLTRNVMEFKGCSVAGFYYSPSTLFPKENEKATDSPLIQDLLSSENPNSETIREFLVLLSICHNVIPEKKTINGKANFIYHASSPDEKALVEGASTLGFKFQMRTPLSIEISAMGKVERYDILNLIEFTSTRKRMTVIVKCPDGLFRLYCKGADSVIFGLLTSKDKKNLMSDVERKTHSHLGAFSIQGLRTLCCAMKVVDKKDYYEWNTKYQKASNSINDREEAIGKAAELIEHDLILLGATAIEDKLQDLVPETIAAFLEAGIKIWVLTGDKQETAINIGNSCKLLDTSMTLLVINQEEEQHTLDCIVAYANRLGINLDHMNKRVLIDAPPRNAAVIVDGMTLVHAMKKDIREPFVSLCCQCKAVIVCRASPMQKAEIVELVTQATGAVSLAIGDGANDVAMIQKANVGVGISGNEGLQAALASDYSIAQFYFLKKLLFVHGAWNHERITQTVYYSFYKNICLYIIELWFAIYSSWSGQIIFERWTLGCFNLFFTCWQPLAMGIFDRNCSSKMRMEVPALYLGTSNGAFTLKQFFKWVMIALFHSMSLFWITRALYGDGTIWGDGKEGGYLILGNCIYTYVVVVVSLKAGLETKAWTCFTHIAIWGSILLWIVFLIGYSALWRTTPLGNEISGVAWQVYSSFVFWIGLFLVPAATLLPDIVFKAISTSSHASITDRYRERRQSHEATLHSQTRDSRNGFSPSVHASKTRYSEPIPPAPMFVKQSRIQLRPDSGHMSSTTPTNSGLVLEDNMTTSPPRHTSKHTIRLDASHRRSKRSVVGFSRLSPSIRSLYDQDMDSELNLPSPIVFHYDPETKMISSSSSKKFTEAPDTTDAYFTPVGSISTLNSESKAEHDQSQFAAEPNVLPSPEAKDSPPEDADAPVPAESNKPTVEDRPGCMLCYPFR